jgi:hypothetical protein
VGVRWSLFTAVEAAALRRQQSAQAAATDERTRDWDALGQDSDRRDAAPKRQGAEDDERFCQIRDIMRGRLQG